MDSLLPGNATPLERTLEGANARIGEVPVPIRLLGRPYEVPAHFLPLLAWELSVDVWFGDWPEATRRAITARSLVLHKRKGTAWALREYVRYAGGEVLGIIAPPQRVVSGRSLSIAEREAWLSNLPQVRCWRIRETATAPARKAFHGGRRRGLFVARSFAVPSTARQRLQRRARWVVRGAETDVTVEDFGSWFRLHLVGVAGARVFANRPCARRFWVPSEAWRRIVTIAPAARLPWRSPVAPALRAVASEPERVVVGGTRGRSVFSMRCFGGSFFVPSSAPLRIYERYPVVDGTGPRRGPVVQIMGRGFYGWPAHTAEVRVSAPGRRGAFAAGDGILVPKSRFWLPHDGEPLQRIRRAAQAAKRLSDRILLDHGPRPRFRADGRPLFADRDVVLVGRP